jgi:PTH1 family peptidyl-tRNA hydrolase
MKLVVGLGNPGKKYEKTRHNCGFNTINFYAAKNNLVFKKKFNAEYCEQVINNEKILLVKPLTYMNLSGNAVIEFVNFYNIDIKDILIIYDDKNFEVGKFKIKRKGSDGGHNGIKNIISVLHTEEIPRIKIGISNNQGDLVDYVLGTFSKSDQEKLNNLYPTISNIIEDFCKISIDELMNKYNGIDNEE